MKLTPLPGRIIVHNMRRGVRRIGSILLRDDDGKNHGIRPRWAQVLAVGDDITEVVPGDWVLIEHGRWTRTMKVDQDQGEPIEVWGVDRDCIMLKSEVEPNEEIIGIE